MQDLGVYWMVCSLIYSKGGPIHDDPVWLGRLFKDADPRSVKAAIDRLAAAGKVQRSSGDLMANGCLEQLQAAEKRIRSHEDRGGDRRRHLNKKNDLGDRGEDSPADVTAPPPPPPPPPPKKEKKEDDYAFFGQIIKLTAPDLGRWKESFPALAGTITGWLESRDVWLAEQSAEIQKKWFQSTSAYLANKNSEASAKNPPRKRNAAHGSPEWLKQQKDAGLL